jgi:hypothetical protein
VRDNVRSYGLMPDTILRQMILIKEMPERSMPDIV